MRRGAVISGIWLAAVLAAVARAAPETFAASDAAVPPPSPVLVVYASANPGAEEARWLAALQPEGEGRRILDGHVKNFTTWVCSADWFNSLTAEQQQWLVETVEEAGE